LLYQVVPTSRVRPVGQTFQQELALVALKVVIQVDGVDGIRAPLAHRLGLRADAEPTEGGAWLGPVDPGRPLPHEFLEAGELGRRSFDEYKGTTDLIVATFGRTRLVDDLAADDFVAL
jgi:hypothetical protein